MSIRQPVAWHPWRGGSGVRPAETARTCAKCGETKPIARFPRSGATGRRTACDLCHNAQRRANPEGRERARQRDREQYRANPATKIRANRRARHKRRTEAGHPVVAVPNRWYSTIRAAMELDRSTSWVQRRCLDGTLHAIKAINDKSGGLCWRIDPASVAELRRKRGGQV